MLGSRLEWIAPLQIVAARASWYPVQYRYYHADRDFSWACSNCTFQNAAGMWQCEMCSHHKPGESYYCVLVLSNWPLILATHYPPSIAAHVPHFTFTPTSRCRLRLRP